MINYCLKKHSFITEVGGVINWELINSNILTQINELNRMTFSPIVNTCEITYPVSNYITRFKKNEYGYYEEITEFILENRHTENLYNLI